MLNTQIYIMEYENIFHNTITKCFKLSFTYLVTLCLLILLSLTDNKTKMYQNLHFINYIVILLYPIIISLFYAYINLNNKIFFDIETTKKYCFKNLLALNFTNFAYNFIFFFGILILLFENNNGYEIKYYLSILIIGYIISLINLLFVMYELKKFYPIDPENIYFI